MKQKGKAIPAHDMKASGGQDVLNHLFLASALDVGERSAVCPGHATWNRAPEPISILWSREKYSELYVIHFKVQTDRFIFKQPRNL
jgi:hypothetical protein